MMVRITMIPVAVVFTLLWIGGGAAEDLNCNGVDHSDEPAVDEDDPQCQEAIELYGASMATTDAYLIPHQLGCSYLLVPDVVDPDGDGLGAGTYKVDFDGHGVDWVVALTCDNCPNVANPDQLDEDRDGVGDLCQDNVVDPVASVWTGSGPAGCDVGGRTGWKARWLVLLLFVGVVRRGGIGVRSGIVHSPASSGC